MSLRTAKHDKLKAATLGTVLLPIALVMIVNGLFLAVLVYRWSWNRSTTAIPAHNRREVSSDVAIAQAKARHVVNIMTRSQQAYYRRHGQFSTDLKDLNLPREAESDLYFYRTFTYRDRQGLVMVAAVPKHTGFKTYVGFVNVLKVDGLHSTLTEATLCESREAKPLLRRLPTRVPTSGVVSCPTGFVNAPMI
ncbi:MAG: type IV pilin-like G/H family protein [Cyanobacteriota bacterium SKYGB_h_bin112]|nr:type IV pilin-like G/H family protein [Cyanobacteriota bacterium SKYGB_h_bin112]